MGETPVTHPTPRSRRWTRLLAIVIGLLLAAVLGISLAIDRYGQVERAQPAQAIVVLGSTVMPNGKPGDSLAARTRHAVALYKKGLAPAIIFTGGRGWDEPRAESLTARDLALGDGVPAGATFTEARSTSTRENIRYAADICRKHGWTRIILVTDPYHLWRGQRNLRQQGLTAYPSPAVDSRRNREWTLRAIWTVRETLLVIRDVITGH